jgi:hypothetical protein
MLSTVIEASLDVDEGELDMVPVSFLALALTIVLLVNFLGIDYLTNDVVAARTLGLIATVLVVKEADSVFKVRGIAALNV